MTRHRFFFLVEAAMLLFGLLENAATRFKKISFCRACPECRQTSDYICPSRYWVETPEEKARLLDDYKLALNKKECKYFRKGEGECPFGNKCFYRHDGGDGREVRFRIAVLVKVAFFLP